VNDAYLQFGGIRVLKGVTLKVGAGECVAVIGPNGAGKTSLVNILTGFYQPTQGSVDVLGKPIAGKQPEWIADLGVARTFQTPQILPHMNVIGNVLLGLHRFCRAPWIKEVLLTREVRRREVEAWKRAYLALERVGLSGNALQPAGELTLGERRLLEIARAIASEPHLLLLDEATSGLAQPEVDKLIDLIAQLRKRAELAIVIIEHSISFVRRTVDRVAVLNQGTLLADGATAEVLSRPSVIEAYLGAEA
jgi:ABC-type branched-subunit amino acid transport system ATPase component